MSKLLQGKRASFVAGHKEMELTEAARDTQCRLWPIGTVYQPSSAGYNGETDRDEQTVHIKGETVVFAGPVRS